MRRTGISAVSLVVFQFCAGHLRVQEAEDPQDVKHTESAESDVARGACPPWAVPRYVAFCGDTSSANGTSTSKRTTEGVDWSINQVASPTQPFPCGKSRYAKVAYGTAARPRSLRGSRFKNVLRVITHAYAHQIDFFLAQGPDFWGTVFVNPRYENETDLDVFRERVPFVDCGAGQLEGRKAGPNRLWKRFTNRDYSYLCVGPFLRSFGESWSFPSLELAESLELSPAWIKLFHGRNTTEVVGAVVHQADFWFHSSFGRGWPLENSIWHMDAACPITPNGWGWFREFDGGLGKRREKIQSVLKLRNLRTCYGSGDFFYVSREGWEMLGKITEIWRWNLQGAFMPRKKALPWWEWKGDLQGVFNSNEVAVPMTMKALQRTVTWTVEICWKDNKNGIGHKSDRSDWDLNRLDGMMCCVGDSDTIAAPETISQARCGHPLKMEDACSKEAYMQSWLSNDLG